MQHEIYNIGSYVYDDLHHNAAGSSSFITNIDGRAEQHYLYRSIFYLFLQNFDCSKNNCKIRIGIQYLPFGELFVNQSNNHDFDSRYKFTAKELDNETNYTYFGARYYDSDLSSWLSVDPLSDKYPSLSPYAYCANNPVVLVDPNGMEIDNYVFGEDGKYIRKEKNWGPDRLVIENQKTGDRSSYFFADPVNDPKAIEDGIVNEVVMVDQEQVFNIIKESGSFSQENRDNKREYIINESSGGDTPGGSAKLDYSMNTIPFEFKGASKDPMNKPSPMLFIVIGDKYAHNHMNFGNFLWGASGYSLGYDAVRLSIGAHYNSLTNAFGNGYPAQFDSPDDQLSIRRGAYFAKEANYRKYKF